jgi:hypothetical protein
MTYPVTNSTYHTIPGGSLHWSMNSHDPSGNYYVLCERHPEKWTQLHCDFLSRDFSVLEEAKRVLANCPGCLTEAKEKEGRKLRSCAQEEHDACGCEL